jgi:hypothetical protein
MTRDRIAGGLPILAAVVAVVGLHQGPALAYECARFWATDEAQCNDSCPRQPHCQNQAAYCGQRGLNLHVRPSFDPSTGACGCEGECRPPAPFQCTEAYCSLTCPSGSGGCIGNLSSCECFCTASWCRGVCQQLGYYGGSHCSSGGECVCYAGGGGGGGGRPGGGEDFCIEDWGYGHCFEEWDWFLQ